MDIIIKTLEQHFVESGKSNLPFYIQYIDGRSKNVSGVHIHDYFQIILIDEGEAEHCIEYEPPLLMKQYTVSVVFPKQIHRIIFTPQSKGVILMFDEALFCSDILKKELSAYNIDLYQKLNCIRYNKENYEKIRKQIEQICLYYDDISPIKKEQIRFFIKILLLQLIDDVHENEQPSKNLPVLNIYARYKELVENQYAEIRTVADYAKEIGISTKRLNNICRQEAGVSALAVLHERIMIESKRMLLFSGESMKEIAFALGFASPASFNKFIYSKTHKTPTELKNSLSQNYKGKDQMDNFTTD